MNPPDYLQQRLDDQIAWYDTKSLANQKAYKRLKVFEIVAASSIPLLSGIAELGAARPIVVGVLGASIAICAGISAVFKFHELWIEYRGTAETLRHHRFLYLTKAQPYHGADAFTLLVDAVEGAISKEGSRWTSLQKPQPQPTQEPAGSTS